MPAIINKAVTDLTYVGGITHRGRIYMPAIIDKAAPEEPSIPAELEQAPKEKENRSTFGKESQPLVEKEA